LIAWRAARRSAESVTAGALRASARWAAHAVTLVVLAICHVQYLRYNEVQAGW